MKFSIKTILRIIFVLSCVNLQTSMMHAAETAQPPARPAQQQRDDSTQTKCPICLTEYSENPVLETSTLTCGHKFHTGCMQTWEGVNNNNQCPFCRQVIDETRPLRIIKIIMKDTTIIVCFEDETEVEIPRTAIHQIPGLQNFIAQINTEFSTPEQRAIDKRLDQFNRRVSLISTMANNSLLMVGAFLSKSFGHRWTIPAIITAVGLNIVFRKNYEAVGTTIINGGAIRIDTSLGYFRNRALSAISYGALGFMIGHTARISANTFLK